MNSSREIPVINSNDANMIRLPIKGENRILEFDVGEFTKDAAKFEFLRRISTYDGLYVPYSSFSGFFAFYVCRDCQKLISQVKTPYNDHIRTHSAPKELTLPLVTLEQKTGLTFTFRTGEFSHIAKGIDHLVRSLVTPQVCYPCINGSVNNDYFVCCKCRTLLNGRANIDRHILACLCDPIIVSPWIKEDGKTELVEFKSTTTATIDYLKAHPSAEGILIPHSTDACLNHFVCTTCKEMFEMNDLPSHMNHQTAPQNPQPAPQNPQTAPQNPPADCPPKKKKAMASGMKIRNAPGRHNLPLETLVEDISHPDVLRPVVCGKLITNFYVCSFCGALIREELSPIGEHISKHTKYPRPPPKPQTVTTDYDYHPQTPVIHQRWGASETQEFWT